MHTLYSYSYSWFLSLRLLLLLLLAWKAKVFGFVEQSPPELILIEQQHWISHLWACPHLHMIILMGFNRCYIFIAQAIHFSIDISFRLDACLNVLRCVRWRPCLERIINELLCVMLLMLAGHIIDQVWWVRLHRTARSFVIEFTIRLGRTEVRRMAWSMQFNYTYYALWIWVPCSISCNASYLIILSEDIAINPWP